MRLTKLLIIVFTFHISVLLGSVDDFFCNEDGINEWDFSYMNHHILNNVDHDDSQKFKKNMSACRKQRSIYNFLANYEKKNDTYNDALDEFYLYLMSEESVYNNVFLRDIPSHIIGPISTALREDVYGREMGEFLDLVQNELSKKDLKKISHDIRKYDTDKFKSIFNSLVEKLFNQVIFSATKNNTFVRHLYLRFKIRFAYFRYEGIVADQDALRKYFISFLYLRGVIPSFTDHLINFLNSHPSRIEEYNFLMFFIKVFQKMEDGMGYVKSPHENLHGEILQKPSHHLMAENLLEDKGIQNSLSNLTNQLMEIVDPQDYLTAMLNLPCVYTKYSELTIEEPCDEQIFNKKNEKKKRKVGKRQSEPIASNREGLKKSSRVMYLQIPESPFPQTTSSSTSPFTGTGTPVNGGVHLSEGMCSAHNTPKMSELSPHTPNEDKASPARIFLRRKTPHSSPHTPNSTPRNSPQVELLKNSPTSIDLVGVKKGPEKCKLKLELEALGVNSPRPSRKGKEVEELEAPKAPRPSWFFKFIRLDKTQKTKQPGDPKSDSGRSEQSSS